MATNTGSGFRKGSVSSRTQTFNPKNATFVKRNAGTGKFMAAKASPFKGVAKEQDKRRK